MGVCGCPVQICRGNGWVFVAVLYRFAEGKKDGGSVCFYQQHILQGDQDNL